MSEQNTIQIPSLSPTDSESWKEGLLFQGFPYLLTEDHYIGRFVASLVDSVDHAALQSALDAVMESSDYFHMKPVKHENFFSIERNSEPCIIYTGDVQRKISDETNGYLFYVSWEADTIYFTFDHFIADGRGAVRFMNELLKAYCNYKYQAGLPLKALRSDPTISPAELMANYTRKRKQPQLTPIIELDVNTVTTCLINIEKAGLIRYAAEHGVKPFSALLFLLGNTIRKAYPMEYLGYSYPVDTRRALGLPNALYNCITVVHKDVCTQQDELSILREIDASVKNTLANGSMLAAMAEHMKPVWDLYKIKVPLDVKQRVYSTSMRTTSFRYMLSYMGSPFAADEHSLEQYLRDYYVIPMIRNAGVFFAAEISFGSHMTFGCTDYLSDKAVAKRFASELESAGIQVNSIKYL